MSVTMQYQKTECLKVNTPEEEDRVKFAFDHMLENIGVDRTMEFLRDLNEKGFRLVEILNYINRKNRCGTRAPWFDESDQQSKH